MCGNCNQDPSDDLKVNPKYSDKIKSDNLNEVLQSWVADEPALNLKEKCVSETILADECVPLPPDRDPCSMQLLDPNVFGQCHLIVNVVKYVSMCQTDLCKNVNQKGVCSHLAAYARECSRNGKILDFDIFSRRVQSSKSFDAFKSCDFTSFFISLLLM